MESKNLLIYFVNDYHIAQLKQIDFKYQGIKVYLAEIEALGDLENIFDYLISWTNDNQNCKIYLLKSEYQQDLYNQLIPLIEHNQCITEIEYNQ